MYEHLRGRLERKSPSEAVVDTGGSGSGGIGFRVQIPLTTYEKLPAAGSDVRLLVILVVREDSQRLFGFATEDGILCGKWIGLRTAGLGAQAGQRATGQLCAPLAEQRRIQPFTPQQRAHLATCLTGVRFSQDALLILCAEPAVRHGEPHLRVRHTVGQLNITVCCRDLLV